MIFELHVFESGEQVMIMTDPYIDIRMHFNEPLNSIYQLDITPNEFIDLQKAAETNSIDIDTLKISETTMITNTENQ